MSKVYTARVLIKHAGSQLRTDLLYHQTFDGAAKRAEMFINQFQGLEFLEPTLWRWRKDETDSSLHWCDRITIPGQDEAHFLFRISIKEVDTTQQT